MVFCRNCGKDLPVQNPSYCPMCGKSQNTISTVTMNIHTKNSGLAVIIALIAGLLGFNGVGHFYVGKVGMGIAVLIVGWILLGLTFAFFPIGVIYIVFWLWQAYDAYQKTKYYNELVLTNGRTPW